MGPNRKWEIEQTESALRREESRRVPPFHSSRRTDPVPLVRGDAFWETHRCSRCKNGTKVCRDGGGCSEPFALNH